MPTLILVLTLFICSSDTMELSCSDRDSCRGVLVDHRGMNRSQAIKDRNCFCDRACFQYDDCCEDLKVNRTVSTLRPSSQATCVDYMYPFRVRSEPYEPTVMPVWMINSCLSNYQYTPLAKNCSNDDETFFTHPPSYIPMTSRRTNFTYRNIYCAQCNNEKIEALINWSFQIVCNGLSRNYLFTYEDGLNMIKLLPPEAERCTHRLAYPSPPAVVYPCKQQSVNTCPA